MKRIVLIILAIAFIFVLTSCGEKEVLSSRNDIFSKLNIGLTVNSDYAKNVEYYIVEQKIAKATFEYDDYHFVYQASMKVNQTGFDLGSTFKREYALMEDNGYTYRIYNLYDSNDKVVGMSIEWAAELETGTYKCFYNLSSSDFIITAGSNDDIEFINYLILTVVGM